VRYSILLRALAVTCTFFVLSACVSAPPATLKTTFVSESLPKNIKSFLVLGLGEKRANSMEFEQEFINALQNQGVTAYSVHKEIGRKQEITKASVIALVKKLNVEAVLVTRLKDVELEINEQRVSKTKTIQKPQFRRLTDIFVYEYEEIETERDMGLAETVTLTTEVYSTTSGGLIAELETKSFEKTEKGQVESESISKIVTFLKSNRIL
jgi:hypothetical protein